jgi:hypothetical protein
MSAAALTQEQVNEVLDRYQSRELVRTLRHFADAPETRRKRTLRSHKKKPIESAREIEVRDDLDEFLEMCCALEVLAVATGEVPALPTDLKNAVVRTLSDDLIKVYYTKTYPTPLPILLLSQLTETDVGAQVLRPARVQGINAIPLLLSFFELDARPWRNQDLEFFFDLIDDYVFDGFGLQSFLDMLGSEKKMARLLAGKMKSSSNEVRALNGFCQFVNMCHDLDRLCERCTHLLPLRAAVWLNFSYWFCEKHEYLRQIARLIGGRLNKSAEATELLQDFTYQTAEFTSLIDKLTRIDWYAQPLVEISAPLLNEWATMHGLGDSQLRRDALLSSEELSGPIELGAPEPTEFYEISEDEEAVSIAKYISEDQDDSSSSM